MSSSVSFLVGSASKLFTISFALIKPFLGQETLDKFAIYGYDKEEWKAALLDEIAADQLPVHYGGTMTDPDGNPLCLTKVRFHPSFAPSKSFNCSD